MSNAEVLGAEEELAPVTAIDYIDVAAGALAKLKAAGHSGVIYETTLEDEASAPASVIVLNDYRRVHSEVKEERFIDPRPDVRTIMIPPIEQPGLSAKEVLGLVVPEQAEARLKVLEANAVKLTAEFKHGSRANDEAARRLVVLMKARPLIEKEESLLAKKTKDAIKEAVGAYLGTLKNYIDFYADHNLSSGHSLEKEDLVIEAQMGVIEALERFDLHSNNQVFTFINYRFKGSIVDSIRSTGGVIRSNRRETGLVKKLEQHEDLVAQGMRGRLTEEEVKEAQEARQRLHNFQTRSLDEVFYEGEGESILLNEVVAAPQLDEVEYTDPAAYNADIERLLGTLDKRHQTVIRMRFGLAPYEDEHTLEAIGEVIDVTASRVSQMVARALSLLTARRNFRFDHGLSPKSVSKVAETEYKPRLTARQQEVYDLACKGFYNEEIAEQLGSSVETVKSHKRRILHTFGAVSIRQAVLRGYRANLTSQEIELLPAQRPLSEREIEVLQAIAELGDNAAAAEALHLSEETIKSHIRRILEAFNAKNAQHAIYIGCRHGVIH